MSNGNRFKKRGGSGPLHAIDGAVRMPRRSFLRQTAAAALLGPTLAKTAMAESAGPPRKPVTVQLCKRYAYPAVRESLAAMFDELGDVRALVKNRFVTVKLNLVNTSAKSVGGIPLPLSVTAHPFVALAAGSLFTEYGAKRVTFCDQLPFEELGPAAFEGYGYDFGEFSREMDGKVRFENTRNLGHYKSYDMVKVPGGGHLADAWEVNKTYTETDVLVSIAKLKSHVSGGVTLGMKNLYGVPPSSLYGDDLGDEPDEKATGYRGRTMHECSREPLTSSRTFTGRSKLGEHGFNVPRLICDLNAAFPIQLTVIDGISAIQNAEGWWLGSIVTLAHAGLLIAGRNPVCTDAAAAAMMGFDPDAGEFQTPFNNGSNHLALAREKGLGENRIENIEIGGIGLEKARFAYEPTYQRPRT